MLPRISVVFRALVAGGAVLAVMGAGQALPTTPMTLVAGNGERGHTDGVGVSARFAEPVALAWQPDGSVLVADSGNDLVRRVGADGVVTTVAGVVLDAAEPVTSPTGTVLKAPLGVAAVPDGSWVAASSGGDIVYRVWPGGRVTTLVGTGQPGAGVDGGASALFAVNMPTALAADRDGGVFVADTLNNRVIRVDADDNVSVVAGTGEPGFSGDGGPATSALLSQPMGVAVDAQGNLLIADTGNRRVRMVSGGSITTLAGDGEDASDGDDGPRLDASFMEPTGVASEPRGGVLVTDPQAGTVRRVAGDNVTLLAGNGDWDSFDPSVEAAKSPLMEPVGVAVDRDGKVFISDRADNRVLAVAASPVKPGAGETLRLHVGDPGQVVFGNLTVTESAAPGWVTVYGCDETRPTTSNVNFGAAERVANMAVVKADGRGDICIYTLVSTHLVWDQAAEAAAEDVGVGEAVRLLDTRTGGGAKVPAGGTVKVHAGPAGATLWGNLTATQPEATGFVTAYPCLESRPTASNVNYTADRTVAAFAAVKADAAGDVCFYTSMSTHILWDQTGNTDKVPAHSATRLLDTRLDGGAKVPADGTVTVHTGAPGKAVIGTLTATQPDGSGFLTAYPCTEARPWASNLNYVTGRTVANLATVKADARGDVCIYTPVATHVIWDQTIETTVVEAHAATRLLDTRIA